MKRNNNVDKEIYQAPTVKESIKVAMSESPLEEFQLELMQTLSQYDRWKKDNPGKRRKLLDTAHPPYSYLVLN